MNRDRLAALAIILGTAITAGGITITAWQAAPGTTAADLADAGVGGCPTRLVSCDWHLNDDGVAVLSDAGVTVPRRNMRLGARVKVCEQADGGRDVVFPPMPQRHGRAALASPNLADCDVAADPGGALWRVVQSRCVRAQPDAGADCKMLLRDGGSEFHGWWNVIPRTISTGNDCVPCACTRFFGVDDCEEC